MVYKEVYSVGIIPSILFIAIIIALMYIFYLIYRYSMSRELTEEKAKIVLGAHGTIILCIIILIILTYIYTYQYINLLANNYQEVDGIVENFKPQISDSNNKRSEQFEIKGVKFEYSTYSITGAYNTIYAKGGYVFEGEQVRLYYHNNDILKIFIAENK